MRVDIPVGLQLLLGTMQSPMLLLKKTAYEITRCLVGSEMCIRDRQSCMPNPVEGLLEVYEDMVEVLLVLEIFLTENA